MVAARVEPSERTHTALAEYHSSPDVRERISEYCGGAGWSLGTFTALDTAGYGGRRWLNEPEGAPVRFPLSSLPALAAEGADVCRSLADAGGTLLLLDLDYESPSDRGEPYRDPQRCFGRLEPVHQALRAAFARRGLSPLVLMTGRGYHYVMRAPAGGALQQGLAELGARGERLPIREDRFTTLTRLALVMELAHHGAPAAGAARPRSVAGGQSPDGHTGDPGRPASGRGRALRVPGPFRLRRSAHVPHRAMRSTKIDQ